MINKHKVSFEFISKKILDKLNDKVKSDLYKYRRVRRKVLEWESDIEGYKSEIKKKQKRIKEYNKILTHLHSKLNYLRDDFYPIVGIVGYKKGLDIYWNVNVKFRKNNRSFYLGKDNKVREILHKKVGVGLRVKKEKIKSELEFYLKDEVIDLVIENKNNFDNWKLSKEEMWKLIK